MEVNDDIFHLGIVYGALRAAAPRFFGLRVIIEEADEIDRVQIDEIEAARVFDPASEYQVQLAHGGPASRILGVMRTGTSALFFLPNRPKGGLRRRLGGVAGP